MVWLASCTRTAYIYRGQCKVGDQEVRVIGMERAGDYRRSAALMWTRLVLLSMQFARIVLDCCKIRGQSAPGVRFNLSPTHRRCNDVCQQLWWTQRHSTASLNPGCDALRPLQNYEQRTAHHGFATRRSRFARPRSRGRKGSVKGKVGAAPKTGRKVGI